MVMMLMANNITALGTLHSYVVKNLAMSLRMMATLLMKHVVHARQMFTSDDKKNDMRQVNTGKGET